MATIPGPRDDDADDVSLALEVAQSQWTRGDYGEALKWLRKAADAAFDADQDQRGMDLSKTAAELKAELDRPRPPQPKPPQPRSVQPPQPKPAQPKPAQPKPAQPKPAQPKPPQPKPAQTRTGPAKPSTPPSRNPQKPEPRKSQRPEANLETTGTRRTTRKPSVRPRPPVEEDEATREYQLADMGPDLPAAAVVDEWPTETLDDLDEVPEHTGARAAQKADKPQKKKPPTKPKKPDVIVPSTRAIRVAVGPGKDTAYVRLLDSQGLREGEHDAMLVALTSDSDLRELFK